MNPAFQINPMLNFLDNVETHSHKDAVEVAVKYILLGHSAILVLLST